MVINTTNQTAAILDAYACKKRGQHGRRRGMLSAGHPEHPVNIMIVEVGYTSETRYAENYRVLQEKMTQHGKLQRALSRVRFEMSILPVILGTTGGVFNSNLDSFRALGIPNERALHLTSQTIAHATTSTTITLASRTPLVSWRLGIFCSGPMSPGPHKGLSCGGHPCDATFTPTGVPFSLFIFRFCHLF